MTIAAKFEHGVFKPLEKVQLEEGTVVEVHLPRHRGRKPASIGELGFSSMWADRDDIEDGLSYVNRLRENPRG